MEFLNVAQWDYAAVTLARVVLIAVVAWIALGVTRRLIRIFRTRITRAMDDPEQVKRVETLGRVFRYIAAVVILVIAITLILSELGIAVAPILGAAGVIGLAVGFGAQSLVKDYFAGFFILLENQIRQGDVVAIADKSGLVEEVTLRYVRLRDYDGNVHIVSNGLITTVTNMSRGFAQSVADVGVAYREDTDEAIGVMREVGAEMRADPLFGPKILDDLDVAGVDKWADSAVILRCRFKVRPLEQWNVRREFLRRLKKAFDARGIEIPFPHLTIYAGVARDGTAPPFRMHDATGTAKRERN
ncbi:MAG: mechanosensitive ion channel protein MscS [Betaproteobacteria bacterium RIFCSPLOWO2_12_FULL_65_110]|nr:MAG: mechanosensitive ion channel protein MscS [Betaproteobacteria bacterium RIFCSPLOWO2_02_FULL_65_20]OGA39137.1 MAG: mechanosensitive ion channel protein MscS [Betaproteobacteria bacterium RIFCSPLOWO2_12_FULL_65_110]